MFSKLVIPYIPNNPPRWPEVTKACKIILDAYIAVPKSTSASASGFERIGWEQFFKITGFPFTFQHIDDFTIARETFRTASTFKW